MSGNNALQIAKVIVDVPGMGCLDYRIPEDMLVAPGDRVVVMVRTRKCVGIVVSIGDESAFTKGRLRSILAVLKDMPPLGREWLGLTRFTAQYYVRGWGEVAMSALPNWLKTKPSSTQEKRFKRMRAPAERMPVEPSEPPCLTPEQQAAFDAVDFDAGFTTSVLFGVTGSGKTEVYLRLMEEALARDPENQVLLLVPEINLTPQLEARVRARFPGVETVSLHSELADGARAGAWLAAHEGRARIVVGTRLSIFTSFRKLSLVIVDEEHDTSFKANDGARFSARDLAVLRGQRNRCPVVLGSATPSLETWANAASGAYHRLDLKNRAVAESHLPTLELFPEPKFHEKGCLSEMTLVEIDKTLQQGRQVLVFLNRRGYSTSVACPSCGWVCTCEHCSTFPVFHKSMGRMICHHCGTSTPVPKACPNCGNVDVLPKGRGTERIEEELEELFPGRTVMRIDRDAVTGKKKAEQAFARVHNGEVDILVGTQMIAKGHDFDNVGLVVILQTDAQLLSPDMRAREHLFSTLMQVSGRAGRRSERGRVIVQTRYPTDVFFEHLAAQDYESFADDLMAERKENWAPPFVHQALLTASADTLEEALYFLRNAIERGEPLLSGTTRLFDAVPMLMVKLQGRERAQLLVEADNRNDLNGFLWRWVEEFKHCGPVDWALEVDPMSI